MSNRGIPFPYLRYSGVKWGPKEQFKADDKIFVGAFGIDGGKGKVDRLVEYFDKQEVAKDKKIICIPGGVGRVADGIRKLGYNVTNLDIQQEFIDIGKINYPEVSHVKGDFWQTDTFKGQYDIAFFEDTLQDGYSEKDYVVMNNWSQFCDVYPKKIPLSILKFNSRIYDQAYVFPESQGNELIKQQMDYGTLEARISYSEMDDFETEDISIEPPLFETNIPPVNGYSYQLLGHWYHIDAMDEKIGFKGLMCNGGLHRKMLRRNKINHGFIDI